MNFNDRKYCYIGRITLRKSRVLEGKLLPKDDIIPWLFLVIDKSGKRRFSFFYKIENPLKARYEEPFNIQMRFLMDEMNKNIELGKTYDVWRGEELIGAVDIVDYNNE